MVWLIKSKYEKHAEKLRSKLLRIVSVMDSSELRQLCLTMIRKVPSSGIKLFDSDYNLIRKFSSRIFHEDYLLFFDHYHMQGKIPDMKLAKYLIKVELLEENDPDYVFIKEFENVDDNDDIVIVRENPRNNFKPEVIEKVLKLQRYRCAVPRCRFPSNSWRFLEKDHIKGREDNSITNCQLLCPFHHRLKTKMEMQKTVAGRKMDNSNMPTKRIRKISRKPNINKRTGKTRRHR